MFEALPFEVPLATQRIGRSLHFMAEVDSTNRVLRELARDGATEGTTVLTDYQNAGRGRQGRSWTTPPGSSLLFSVLLRPAMLGKRAGLLPILSAVGVAQALETHLSLTVGIKWPNDVMLDGKKSCGILIESESNDSKPVYIVGIGLNVNQEADAFEGLPEATSLRLASGRFVERGPLLAAILGELECAYDDFLAGWQPHEAWRQRSTLLGKPIVVKDADGSWTGTALDLAEDGGLLVERLDGRQVHLHAADVSVRSYHPA
jgi:BirA family transcriptional regulator, biotin operon repressor / biotin---[acetyl-CoA-carboxylase] ligase